MEESPKTCGACRHFRQHYVRIARNQYRPLHKGHCVNPRCRDKEVATPACHRYSAKPRS